MRSDIEAARYRLRLLLKRSLQALRPVDASRREFVFVGGNQRSGTNMLMDVLERSRETDIYHERDERAFDNYQMREVPVIRRLAEHSSARVFVIKALCELQALPELMEEFTPSRLVWIVRDYRDVVNSMMRSFSGFSRQLADIARDRNASSWRGRGMSDQTHEIVRKYAACGVNEETAAALQWYYRNILLFERELDEGENTLVVKYESLVTRPDTEFSRIFEFLGLKYTAAISGNVFASSVSRNEAPDIDPEVEALCTGLTERFSKLVL